MSEDTTQDCPVISGEDDITYEEIRTQGMELRIAGDSNAFGMGDLAVKAIDLAERAKERVKWARHENEPPNPDDEALKEEGKNILKKLANDVGWAVDTLVTGARICRRFPPTHRLRTRTPLSYHHARALVLVKDEREVERLIDEAVAERYSVSKLFDKVGQSKTSASVAAGMLKCFNCGERIRDEEVMVRVQQYNEKTLFCGWTCTEAFVIGKSANDAGGLDDLENALQMPDEDSLELAAAVA